MYMTDDLHFSQQLPLWQAGLQLKQLRVGAWLIGASVDALIHRAGIGEAALPLHWDVHTAAVLAVLVNDVGLVGPVWVALQPLGVLNVQNGAHSLPGSSKYKMQEKTQGCMQHQQRMCAADTCDCAQHKQRVCVRQVERVQGHLSDACRVHDLSWCAMLLPQ